MKRITAKAVAEMITNDSVVIPGGFGCCGHPDLLTQALSERFSRERQPTGLTLLFASGAGDKQGNGLDKLAHPNLVKRAIG
jgi:propionate CoA-transferase